MVEFQARAQRVGAAALETVARRIGAGDFSARLDVSTGDELAELRVSDTGTGIPDAVRDRIFEPFFTTKEVGKGTGLGLSLVDEIVRKHRGTLELDTEPGKGATFRVLLPIEGSDGEGSRGRAVARADPGQSGTRAANSK